MLLKKTLINSAILAIQVKNCHYYDVRCKYSLRNHYLVVYLFIAHISLQSLVYIKCIMYLQHI